MKRGAARRGSLLGFAAMLLFPLVAPAQTSSPGLSRDHTRVPRPTPQEVAPHAPGRLLVKFRPEVPAEVLQVHQGKAQGAGLGLPTVDALNASAGATLIQPLHGTVDNSDLNQRFGISRWFVLEVDASRDILELAEIYAADPNIEYASPDWQIFPDMTPNDPLYSHNWGHENSGQFRDFCRSCGGHNGGNPVGSLGFDADADGAWSALQGYGDPGVTIAIVDTGVDLDHPDLRLVPGYDFGDDDNDPDDDAAGNGHGTATAGIAAARADNAQGIAGIAGGCSVLPVKIANRVGAMFLSALQSGLIYAADRGADVISMSLGVSIPSDPATDDALAYAHNAGSILVAASGNQNDDQIDYPANHPLVVAVGAASPCGGRKRSSSNGGDVGSSVRTDPLGVSCDGEYWWGSSYGSTVQDAAGAIDLLGPTILPTTDVLGGGGLANGDYHSFFNGTSAATPYVAGVFALVRSSNPTLTSAEIVQRVLDTARDVTNAESGAGWDRYAGYGLVNAAAAVGGGPIVPTLPYATLPYANGFEGGSLSNEWALFNSDDGRTVVTSDNGPHTGSQHLTFDDPSVGGYTLNEAWLRLDLAGEGNVGLDFWLKDFGDEVHSEDGIYFSDNGGQSFARVLLLDAASLPNGQWTPFHLDVDELASSNGVALSSTFVVKFQQFDNRPIPSDGIAIDDIVVTAETGVPASLTLTAPNGGETLSSGAVSTVTWTSAGSIPTVDLSYSLDGGATWTAIASGVANDGAENWTVPGQATTQGRVRVSGNSGFVEDLSDGDFVIDTASPLPPPAAWATLPYSTGFESGELGASWRASSDADGRVRVLDSDGPRGSFHLAMDDEVRGGYSLNDASLLLNLAGNTRVELRFWWKDFGDETNPQDGVFVSDDGGDTFVKIYDMNSDTLPNDTWHETVLDLDQLAGANGMSLSETFVVKFQQYDNYPMPSDGIAIDDISVLVPSAPAATVTLTSPNGGETLLVDSTTDITWTSTGDVSNVALVYSNDGGASWNEIVTSTANDGTHEWMVPDDATTQARVRVSDATEPEVADVSDGDFTIEHDITPPPPSGDYASLPYFAGFEGGALDDYWTTASSNEGRVLVTSADGPASGGFHLTLDDDTRAGEYALNEARLHVDLSGESQIKLEFAWKEFGDEAHAEDGVFFSDDGGATFTKVLDLSGPNYGNNSWQAMALDLDQLATTAGLSLSSTFVVKFQQYDNYPIGSDGHAYDDILVAVDSGTDPPGGEDPPGGDPPGGDPPGGPVTAEVEPNDAPSQANGPLGPSQVSGEISSATDVDWFTFEVDAASTTALELAIGSAADLDMYLYDANLNELKRAYTSNNPETMSVFLTRSTYFLKIVGYRGATSSYTLSLNGAGISKTTPPALPNAFALHANQPNPFNPQTRIAFDLPRASRVRLAIYNLRGQLVAELVNDHLKAGSHAVIWNGRDDRGGVVASGVYLYHIVADGFQATRKMTLAK